MSLSRRLRRKETSRTLQGGALALGVLLVGGLPSRGVAQVSFGPRADFETGLLPSSIALGDVNGDGRPDLVIANTVADSVSVLVNTTSPGASVPSFAPKGDFATGSDPVSVALGDLNGDGLPEVVIGNADPGSDADTLSVHHNTTTPGGSTPDLGSRVNIAAGDDLRSVALRDLNGDGRLDVVATSTGSEWLDVFFNTTAPGAPPFSFDRRTRPIGNFPIAVALGDLNGDGRADVAVADNVNNSVSVLINELAPGATTPTDLKLRGVLATGRLPISLALADLNGDGRPDLATATGDGVSVLLNTTAPGATQARFTSKVDFPFPAGRRLNAVAFGDLNGDGRPDMVGAEANADVVTVLLNSTIPGATTPRFTPGPEVATGRYPLSLALADLNGDGRADLATADAVDNAVSVSLNSTTLAGVTIPTFAEKTTFGTATGGIPEDVALGDLNGDGRADLATANQDGDSLSVLLNSTPPGAATPSFTPKTDFATGNFPLSIALGDLNGDGRADLATANFRGRSVSVLLNTTPPGAATPSLAPKADFATGSFPNFVALGDLNGDARADLATTNFSEDSVSVLLNATPPGAAVPSFAPKTDVGTGDRPQAITLGDLNGDGRPDLAIPNFGDHSVSVLLNTTPPGAATPSFTPKTDFATGNFPLSIALGDLNGDGRPDLATANQNGHSVSVLLNTTTLGATTPSFSLNTDFATGFTPVSVALSDINGDGRPDLATSNFKGPSVSVLLNTTPPGAAMPSFAPKADFAIEEQPRAVSLGDLNGDGRLDLAVSNLNGPSVAVLLNATGLRSMFISLGAGGVGWVEAIAPIASHVHQQWWQVPWTAYNVALGETRPAVCDFDGDGLDEMILGLGSFPSNGGWVEVRDDRTTGYARLAWIRVTWAAYNAANGETFPACGDLDGDNRDEIALGLGAGGGGGWVQLFDDATTDFAPLPGTPFANGWARVAWSAYNAANGEVHPAIGNLDTDAAEELVLGLGAYPRAGGWLQILDDATAGFAPLSGTPTAGGWIRVPWSTYNGSNGETRPAVCDLNGEGQGEVVLGLGASSRGWIQLRDAGTGFGPLTGTPTANGWAQVSWRAYTSAGGGTFPTCGDLDGDGRDELVLGLEPFPSNGGWVEVKEDLASNLVNRSWAQVNWPTYNNANGETRPAVER